MILFSDFISTFTHNRFLLGQFTSREFKSRYKGTYLGFVWSIMLPIILIATYTFVFGFVFKSRWASHDEGAVFFAVTLFAGLIPFNFFSDLFTSSAFLIQSNTNLVKKVVFPLEILILSRVFSSLMHSGISFLILLILLFQQNLFHQTWILYPVILFPFILFVTGISFIISALSVFIRDIGQILGVVVSLLMFLSPIFYKIESIPAKIRPYVALNPIATIAEESRAILIFGNYPSQSGVLWLWIIGISTLIIGIVFFKKLKNSFADVL
jgi:lipopolysaccharide transport system permease protein